MITDARALSVGVAEPQSHIGEPLIVRIPLFDVVDPSSLTIDFESLQFDGRGQVNVDARLSQSKSQWLVELSSDELINEPYINFKLDIVGDGSRLTREFTVLMHLPTQVEPMDSAVLDDNIQPKIDVFVRQGSIMGPYDTAQAGQVPAKFGAVLDGQSLWRVARRINQAMGVSLSQMMWGLYQANPEAFSNRSVSSLKAGSYLTIPDQSLVNNVSESQALGLLSAVELESRAVGVAKAKNAEKLGSAANLPSLAQGVTAKEVAGEDSFQVTSIDSDGQTGNGPIDGQSQKIILSLTETVGNLSHQLSARDEKIEFLEKQIVELKDFIDRDELTASELKAVEPGSLVGLEQPSVLGAMPESIPVREASSAELTQNQPDRTVSQAPTVSTWQWLLFFFLALSVLSYFMRDRFRELAQSLNLFGSNDRVEFDNIAPEEVGQAIEENQKRLIKPSVRKDYSGLNAVSTTIDEDEDLDPDFDPDFDPEPGKDPDPDIDLESDAPLETDEVWEFGADEVSENLEDLSFNERFEHLLQEEDFEFARELLDFARYNEINDERYHCERLRLFEKMNDEDGFYQYYYQIESKIPSFPQNLQTQISTLVVLLSRRSDS